MWNIAEKPRIFVSYSHRDEEAKDFVDRHLKVLETAGSIDVWHDRKITVGDDWYQKIEAKLGECAVAVLLISTDFLASEFCIKEEVSRLLERRKRDGMMIAPILLRPCAWEIFPWLSAIQMLPRDNTPLLELQELQQERELKEVVLAIHKFLKEQGELIAAAVENAKATGQRTEVRGDNNTVVQVDGANVQVNIVAGPRAGTTYPPLANESIDLTRLPTSGFSVVGRDKELQILNEAFDSTALNVVSLRAWGGVGKSTLVNKWCEYLAADNFRGARRVFAWSFYSQGTNERVTSASTFVDQALRFFGDDDPTAGSPWARGERLAQLVGRGRKHLLILDGMEPLQDAHQGIKDPALARLVECLAEDNAGLCLITTREPIKEFSNFPETTYEIDLEQLSKEAGRALLRIKGLRGADDRLERASDAFGNHALALNLLANYLKRFADGDVSQALAIPDLPDATVDAGKDPRRVMAAFAEKFGEGPELDLLRIMGLFNRPADGGCIQALREAPTIHGLTDHLVHEGGGKLGNWWRRAIGLREMPPSDVIWRRLLAYLRDLGLLAEASHHAPSELDAHPLVREHFGALLRDKREDVWKAGHDRLYAYLQTVPEKHQPDTLTEMAPLFQAVQHAVMGSRFEEAIKDVYQERINRSNNAYALEQLGAASEILSTLSERLEYCRMSILAGSTKTTYPYTLNEIALCLRRLGRITDSIELLKLNLSADKKLGRQDWACVSARNLSDAYLATGDLRNAELLGIESVEFADLGSERIHWIDKRCALANTYRIIGMMNRSKEVFDQIRLLKKEHRTSYPIYSILHGYFFSEYILETEDLEDVKSFVTGEIHRSVERRLPFDEALLHCVLGRVEHGLGNFTQARFHHNRSVEMLRAISWEEYLALSLLHRGILHRNLSEFPDGKRDLQSALRMAGRGKLRLYECDAHLEYVRLALAEDDPVTALHHFQSADALATDCGYHRRDPEIAELKEKLGLRT